MFGRLHQLLDLPGRYPGAGYRLHADSHRSEADADRGIDEQRAADKMSSIVGDPVQSIMQTAFPYVDIETPVTLLASMITPEHPAVLLRDFVADTTYIVTGYDVLKVI